MHIRQYPVVLTIAAAMVLPIGTELLLADSPHSKSAPELRESDPGHSLYNHRYHNARGYREWESGSRIVIRLPEPEEDEQAVWSSVDSAVFLGAPITARSLD
jgi:hypothetical protein